MADPANGPYPHYQRDGPMAGEEPIAGPGRDRGPDRSVPTRAGRRSDGHRPGPGTEETIATSRLVVYFTLAMWLFRGCGYDTVLRNLVEGLAWTQTRLGRVAGGSMAEFCTSTAYRSGQASAVSAPPWP